MSLLHGHTLKLLVNPAAGRGRAGRRLAQIARCLESKGVPFDCSRSEGPGHLTELARSLEEQDDAGLVPVVCGGDGSLNEVVNGLSRLRAPLGVIPAGTGNDIARNLGIPASVEEACDTLLTGVVRTLDLISAGGRLFAGIGGAGVDSEVTRRANRIRLPIPGHAVYTIATLSALASFRPCRFTISSADWVYRGTVMFAGVANAPTYGGGMRLSPHSRMDDGVFEVCIVESMGRLELLRNFPRLFRGTHLTHPRVRLLTARRLRLEAERPVDFYADGEYHQPLPVDISVVPAALSVIVPAPGKCVPAEETRAMQYGNQLLQRAGAALMLIRNHTPKKRSAP
jgi:YegS/Rv2252/BmrU family lipid kinase